MTAKPLPAWVPTNMEYVESWVPKSYQGSTPMTRWKDPTGNTWSYPSAGPSRDRRY